ncbi:uncharacterized protein B0P05DRAFT_535742, partial [Gilbertella persicaria]|uniref:uncharacterized protein n=1 Tax=Gilbertella persicaria TaxID=101096 RepID=UPI0022201067
MSLSKELDNLLYWSQKASSVQFHKQKNKAVEHDLEHVKKRKLLRDAKPTEYNLKGLCESDKSIARKFEEEIASLETITIDKKDIEHRLQLLLDMSDMSGNPDIRNMTQHQLHQYQMMEARLEELRTIHEQNDRDIETLKNSPDHLDITDQDMGTHSQELQQQTEKSKQLEAQLTEKRAKLAELRKSKAEHQQINHKLRTIQFDHYKHTEKDQHLATLKRDIKEKKQALEELSSKQKHKTYIETLIDQLNVCLHDTKDAVDASHLLQAFTTVKQQLEQPHTSFKSWLVDTYCELY